MFPTVDSDRIYMSLILPEGTESKKVLEVIDEIKIENFLEDLPETSVFSVTVTSNKADILLELLPFKERENFDMRTSSALEKVLVEKFKTLEKDIIFQAQREKKGPKSEFPVGFRIKMQDASQLQDAKNVTKYVTELLKTIEGTQGVTNSITEIPGEFNFIIDKEKAFLRGVNPLDIPASVRGAVYGDIITSF